MADQHHLDLLKQGVKAWNIWRIEHSKIRPDLNRADLSGAHLSGADLIEAHLIEADLIEAHLSGAHLIKATLRGAHLNRANLTGADLREADLSGAHLIEAYLNRADLNRADLSGADLSGADLIGAHLDRADLSGADLSGANLIKANLSRANLSRANLSGANLRNAHLTGATASSTIFGNTDLREVKGLETMRHFGPSTIGIDTLYRSEGHIPEVFLREAGVLDHFLIYLPSLFSQPIQYYTCFISYSSHNEAFAERLRADLQSQSVRCWFAPHDLRPGTWIHEGIDQAIRVYDKLVLILSEQAIASEWVRFEVNMALQKERERKADVLFPLRIDRAILTCQEGWAQSLRARHIGDFEHWKQHDAYQQAFTLLLHHLQTSSHT